MIGSKSMSNNTLKEVADVLEARKSAEPDSSYVAKLYDKGLDAILIKVGEEATEVVMAAKDAENGKSTDSKKMQIK